MICRLVDNGYGSFQEVLDLTYDQIALIAGGGKLRRGIPIRSAEDLERHSQVRLPDVR